MCSLIPPGPPAPKNSTVRPAQRAAHGCTHQTVRPAHDATVVRTDQSTLGTAVAPTNLSANAAAHRAADSPAYLKPFAPDWYGCALLYLRGASTAHVLTVLLPLLLLRRCRTTDASADGAANGPAIASTHGTTDASANGTTDKPANGAANGTTHLAAIASTHGAADASADGTTHLAAVASTHGAADKPANGTTDKPANGAANGTTHLAAIASTHGAADAPTGRAPHR